MNDPRYKLFTLFVATLSSFTVWLSILTGIDPNKSDPITKVAFFSSWMLFLIGLLSMLLIYINMMMKNKINFHTILAKSILHASLLSIFITTALVLETIKVLGILELGILIFLLILLELYLKAKNSMYNEY